MKKTLVAVGASALALLTAGIAVAQAGDSRPDRNADVTRAQLVAQLDARFADLDTNKDGNISADERKAKADARRAEHFKRLDADGNGAITQAEMQAAHEKRAEARAERRAERGEAGAERHGKRGGMHHFGGRGGKADANGDGLVSKAEFQARALERFDRADADRNGTVTAAERQQARATMKAQRTK